MFTSRLLAQRQGITPLPCMSPSQRKFQLPPLHFVIIPHSSPGCDTPRPPPPFPVGVGGDGKARRLLSRPFQLRHHPVDRWRVGATMIPAASSANSL